MFPSIAAIICSNMNGNVMKYTRGKNGMYAGDFKVVSVLRTI